MAYLRQVGKTEVTETVRIVVKRSRKYSVQQRTNSLVSHPAADSRDTEGRHLPPPIGM